MKLRQATAKGSAMTDVTNQVLSYLNLLACQAELICSRTDGVYHDAAVCRLEAVHQLEKLVEEYHVETLNDETFYFENGKSFWES